MALLKNSINHASFRFVELLSGSSVSSFALNSYISKGSSGFYDGRSALHVPFYVKDVLLVGVGQVFVAGVLCQVILVAEKRAHAPKPQDTLAAVHDRDLVLGHQLLSQFLITEAVRGLGAAVFGLAQAVDGLLAQRLRDLFQR